MKLFQPGQRVNVDVFGLGSPGSSLIGGGTIRGTVVGLAPGTVIVRLDDHAGRADIAVGPSRIEPAR